MPYTGNLLIGNWNLNNAVKSGNSYTLNNNSKIYLDINEVQFITSPIHYQLSLEFLINGSIDVLNRNASAYVTVIMHYFEGSSDKFNFILHPNSKNSLLEDCKLRNDSSLNKITVEVRTLNMPVSLTVSNIELRRFITDLESHNSNEHPHNLPLNIFVNQQGIKAMKGQDVKFWLKDNGDAIFAGTLEAAEGTFRGTLEAGNINIGDGKFVVDTEGNVTLTEGTITWSGVNKPSKGDLGTWTTKIDSDGIYTGTLASNQVIVGIGNLDGTISSLNSAISSAQGSANSAYSLASGVDSKIAQWAYTNNVTLIDGAKIYTGTIAAKSISADKISTTNLYAERIYNPSNSTAYMELNGAYGDLTIRVGGGDMYQLYNEIGALTHKFYGISFMQNDNHSFPGSTVTRPLNRWDFTDATVTGLNLVAKFG